MVIVKNKEMAKIFYGTIQVKIGKALKTIEKVVWKEGDTIYAPHKNPFKETAFIYRIVESKEVGKTNY